MEGVRRGLHLFIMGKAPAFQFYAGDRAMELMGLDNEATGAWTRAVMYLWTSGPAPEQRLADVAGKGWDRVRFLFSQFDGGISLEWMEESREKQRFFREEAAKHGAKGGRPSKGKKGSLNKPLANPNPTQRVGSMKNEGEVENGSMNAEVEPTFAQWFDLYDKRRDRAGCVERWSKLDQPTREAIMQHTRSYVAAQPDKTYRKDPIRYLSKRGWEDEVVTAKAQTNGQSTEQDYLEKQRMVVEANAKFYREQREFEERNKP